MAGPVSRIGLGGWVAAGLLGLSVAAAARDTPLQPLGVQVRGVVGVSSALVYRDLVLKEGTSPWGNFLVSGHGVSLSGWASVDSESQETVSELFLAYSHKLPVIDLHVGLSRPSIPTIRDDDALAGRVTVSSNNSTRVVADFSLDRFFHGSESLLSGSVTVALIRRERWLVDARAGMTTCARSGEDLEGWSARLLAAYRPAHGPRLTAYLGYAETTSDDKRSTLIDDGFISGLSLGFR